MSIKWMVHPHNHFAFVAIKKKKLYIKSHFSVLAIFNKSHVNTIKKSPCRITHSCTAGKYAAAWSCTRQCAGYCFEYMWPLRAKASRWVGSFPAEVCNLPHQCLTRLHTSARDCTHPSVCFCSKRSHIFIWLWIYFDLVYFTLHRINDVCGY